jgi:hypothetical protein
MVNNSLLEVREDRADLSRLVGNISGLNRAMAASIANRNATISK